MLSMDNFLVKFWDKLKSIQADPCTGQFISAFHQAAASSLALWYLEQLSTVQSSHSPTVAPSVQDSAGQPQFIPLMSCAWGSLSPPKTPGKVTWARFGRVKGPDHVVDVQNEWRPTPRPDQGARMNTMESPVILGTETVSSAIEPTVKYTVRGGLMSLYSNYRLVKASGDPVLTINKCVCKNPMQGNYFSSRKLIFKIKQREESCLELR